MSAIALILATGHILYAVYRHCRSRTNYCQPSAGTTTVITNTYHDDPVCRDPCPPPKDCQCNSHPCFCNHPHSPALMRSTDDIELRLRSTDHIPLKTFRQSLTAK